MDQERFQRLEGILEAIWQAPEQRDRLLETLCASDTALRLEAERLLDLDEVDSFLEDSPLLAVSPGLNDPDSIDPDWNDDSDIPTIEAGRPVSVLAPESAGTRIGSYEIIRPLGEGGMGVVYLARRHDGVHGQEVALKIMSTAFQDAGVRERFRAEREILALLSHPNIARLLDGGATTDGRPYLVMERVDGVPIDEYSRSEELSLSDRLELFKKVCSAVQEAHRSLIVHRDLKPANILVDSRGEPKLLDFGIAKLLSPDALSRTPLITATGNQPMTPAYASPEQVAGGAITTAVDVYALGILLHELLTGARPYDLSGIHLAEAIRQICLVVPPKPSSRIRSWLESGHQEVIGLATSSAELRQLERRLRGDLDDIVSMALRKEPERRYPSAESLREDVERYLDGRPVKAAVDSWLYRCAKFIRRHRAGVTAAGIVMFFSMTFTGIVVLQHQQVKEERNRATYTSEFLLDLFVGVDPWSVETHNPSAAEMLDRGRKALADRASAGPDRAGLLHTIGTAYGGIGRYTDAEELLRAALEERLRVDSDDRAKAAETMGDLAEVLRWQGKLSEGLELVEQALRIHVDLDLSDSREGVVATIQHANFLDALGRYAVAEKAYRAAVESSKERGYTDLEAISLERLGMAKRRLRLFDEALEVLEASLAAHLQTYGREHPRTAQALQELGTVRLAIGEIPEARRNLDEAEGTLRRLLGDGHPEHSLALIGQGNLALALGDHEEAETRLLRAEEALRERLGEHSFLADALRFKSTLMLERELPQEAESAAREALRIFRKFFGESHLNTADAEHRLALALAHSGRIEEAREHIARVVALLEDLTSPTSPPTVFALGDAGWIEILARNYPQAEAKLSTAIASLERFYGHSHVDLAKLYNNLAIAKHSQGAFGEAEAGYRKAMEISRETLGEAAPFYGALHTNLARLLVNTGRLEEAALVLERGDRTLDQAGLSKEHLWRLHADRIRAKIWLEQGRHTQVDALIRPWLERLESTAAISPSERSHTAFLMVTNLEAWGRREEAAELRRHFGFKPQSP